MQTPRLNTYNDFKAFVHFHSATLNPAQVEIAQQLFAIPLAGGKSTLIALLFKYDLEAGKYLNAFSKVDSDQYRTS